ncbi:MAG: DNA-binding response regulator [Dehalococcoidia bacterium]|nr:MAG: DNA-binding response regulator [Dehalococcoidia bacterium]
MGPCLLLVDDDPAVLRGLSRALTYGGYAVLTAPDGETALALLEREEPALIILDIVLPDIDGLTLCQRIRTFSHVPVLMLTARDTIPDRVAGLDQGADDYLVKPFALDELLARVRALLRRPPLPASPLLQFADLTLDLATLEARRGDTVLALTPTERKLLETFLRHPRHVLSRERLSLLVWGFPYDRRTNFIDVAIKSLRRKLATGDQPPLIHTVRGVGYILREEEPPPRAPER